MNGHLVSSYNLEILRYLLIYKDLILTIIQRFAGKELSSLVSKYMLIDTNRSSQAAFKVALPSTYDIEDELVTKTVELIRVNLHKSFSINQLAETLKKN